jgi:RNA-directed DNA polymerase
MMRPSILSPPNALDATERVGSMLPANPHHWDLTSITIELGFRNRSQLGAALGAIKTRGYHVFALTDDRDRRRVIHAPHEWLKAVQRRAYERILTRLPVSDAVYSRAGRGVVKNAEQHIGRAYLTIADVADCFPSTTVEMVVNSLLIQGVPGEVAGALTRLGTYHGFLPQGPPTSPAILDLVFGPIDNMLGELAETHGATYTRYMDDLAFSADRPLAGLDREVISVLRDFGYKSKPSKLRV